jgi:hypothetical protein
MMKTLGQFRTVLYRTALIMHAATALRPVFTFLFRLL